MCAFCFRTLNFDRFCFVANMLGSFDVMCELCINAARVGFGLFPFESGVPKMPIFSNTGITEKIPFLVLLVSIGIDSFKQLMQIEMVPVGTDSTSSGIFFL